MYAAEKGEVFQKMWGDLVLYQYCTRIVVQYCSISTVVIVLQYCNTTVVLAVEH